MGATQKGYAGILKHFIEVDEQGLASLTKTCLVAGLGGERERDGSYQYYINEPVGKNDRKGVGAFILASVEMEKLRE